MRIVIISKSKRHTKIYFYLKKAFQQLGHKAFWIKYPKLKSYFGEKTANSITRKLLLGLKPDLLFLHGRDMPMELLRWAKKRMPVFVYYDDCIQGSGGDIHPVVAHGCEADIMYITNRGEIPIYRKWGVNAKFITGGCDSTAHRIVGAPGRYYQSDVAFIGKPNTPERVACMQAVDERFDLKLWGSGWEKFGLAAASKNVYASGYRKICAGAKIILGWNIDPTVDLYFSNRTWYTLGCGGFLLTLYSPSLETLFGRGRELDWFESIDECCQKIEYYLGHPEERQSIARAGYELAHQKYNYINMAEQILSDLARRK